VVINVTRINTCDISAGVKACFVRYTIMEEFVGETYSFVWKVMIC